MHKYIVNVLVLLFVVVADSVLKRAPHVLMGQSVNVAALQPAPPSALVFDDNIEPKRLLAKRLPPGSSLDDLQSFFSRVSAPRIICWTIGIKPSTALLDFEQQPGISLWYHAC